jgi:hypothetical protein
MSHPIYPQEGAVGKHWIEVVMDFRGSLDTIVKGKVFAPAVIES